MRREQWLTAPALALVLIALLVIPALIGQAQATPAAQATTADQVQTVAVTFDAALQTQQAAADGTLQQVMRSGPINAGTSFSFLWFSWQQADSRIGTARLEVRTGVTADRLSEWLAVTPSDDFPAPNVDATRRTSAPIAVARGDILEVRVIVTAGVDGSMSTVSDVIATVFDTTAAVTAPQADQIEPRMPGRSTGRPPIVSRTAWGNPDGQDSPRVPQGWTTYYPTTHIVIHHTATAEVGENGSAVAMLRAIWAYHANSLGWGDIGYNYLIDRNGVIYEGRAGGDNVSGFHDAANEASMGVALIGDYSNQPPSTAAQRALVSLIAWKVEQRGLDPNGSGFYLGCQGFSACETVNPAAVLPVITTHRDIARSTRCPGDAFHTLLAGIRQRVTQELGGIPAELLLVEETSSGFARSSANWLPRGCGSGGGSLDTYSTDRLDESTNIGTWTPTIVRAGRYRVEAFVGDNCSGGQRTGDARYRIVHSGGATQVSIDQQNRSGWVDMGLYDFAPGVAAVTLTDLNSEPYALRRLISYDAVRWTPVSEEITLLGVDFAQTTLQVGELLEVRFTIRNSGSLPIDGQAPRAAERTSAAATAFDLDGYVYNADECFVAPAAASYPSYPKQSGRFRVMLGGIEGVGCGGSDAAAADYPWRWGIGATLQPGETRTIVGYLRFVQAGSYRLNGAVNQEDRATFARNVNPTTITVLSDQAPALPIMMNDLLQPQAQVLRLAAIPTNALNRLSDARQIRTARVLGRFVWSGETLRWTTNAPVAGALDNFVIQQTRVISVPVSGSYTFRLTTDDMGWLWVNGQLVTANLGLGDERSSSGAITLAAGRHTLAVKIVARTGNAAAGYQIRRPGATQFRMVTDGVIDADTSVENRIGNAFRRLDGLYVAADSLGGARPTVQLLYGDAVWAQSSGGQVGIAALVDNSYELAVRALNSSTVSNDARLRLVVNQTMPFYRQLIPLTER